MLKKLHLHNIGPAPDLEAEFGSRLNLITGDNGLGKSFLLDACWFGLTQTWADGRMFYPAPGWSKDDPPRIESDAQLGGGFGSSGRVEFHPKYQTWHLPSPNYTIADMLVLYARIDGGFSVWDSMRYDKERSLKERAPIFNFSKEELWNGLPLNAVQAGDIICNGLVRDVETWRLKGNGAFELLQSVLRTLSANESEPLRIGESMRVGMSAQDIPTLLMPYGSVPVTQAASGIRRVLALAYLVVWAWEEHKRAAEQKQEKATRHLVLLFDEVEAHLHPKWQKVFLPALVKVANSLLMKNSAQTMQIIATTHAPLVLGSVETLWDDENDQLFDFDLENGKVELEAIPFAKHGSAENWLESDSFDLVSGYSTDAQAAMDRADAFMEAHPDPAKAPAKEAKAIHDALRKALGGDDEYWPYWKPYSRRLGKKA